MMTNANSLPRREAGSPINRTVTIHTNRVPGIPAQAASGVTAGKHTSFHNVELRDRR
jgi:hypothetical protein